MAVSKPRNRIVTFRLAEEEFEQLKNLSAAEGARSLSDYARAAVCNAAPAKPGNHDGEMDARVTRLDGKVEELDRAVRALSELMGRGVNSQTKAGA